MSSEPFSHGYLVSNQPNQVSTLFSLMGYIKLSKPPNILIIYKEQNLVKTILLVLRERLELSRLMALAFEASVATNFTIRAYYLVGLQGLKPWTLRL